MIPQLSNGEELNNGSNGVDLHSSSVLDIHSKFANKFPLTIFALVITI